MVYLQFGSNVEKSFTRQGLDGDHSMGKGNLIWSQISNKTVPDNSLMCDTIHCKCCKATNNTINVEQIMEGWTRQAGYPIVEINRVYNSADRQKIGGGMVISQQPFSLFSTTPKQNKWWIPFKYFDRTSNKVNENGRLYKSK